MMQTSSTIPWEKKQRAGRLVNMIGSMVFDHTKTIYMSTTAATLLLLLLCLQHATGFMGVSRIVSTTVKQKEVYNHQGKGSNNYKIFSKTTEQTDTIVSPFDPTKSSSTDTDGDDELPLTRENVELVLDEMRPYLKSDGGNVRLAEIDGPVVKLELEGACGSCPSSSMTMKMGLERRLKERIPEIAEVIQSLPDAPALTAEGIETVLDGVRPFLSVAGGKISVQSITGVGGLQPVVTLKMEGSAASLQSVKVEIMQRIQRHFMMGLKIEWV